MQTQAFCRHCNACAFSTLRPGQAVQRPRSSSVRGSSTVLAWGESQAHCKYSKDQETYAGPTHPNRPQQLHQQQQQQQPGAHQLLLQTSQQQRQRSSLRRQQKPLQHLLPGQQQQQQQLQQQCAPVPTGLDVLLHQCSSNNNTQQQQQQQQLVMLRACDSSSNSGPKPEPAAGSGAPPHQSAGNSAGKPETSAAQQQQQQQPEQQQQIDAADSTSETELEAAVDKMLDRTWQELKRDLKKEMSPEQAAMIDSWNLSDIQTDKVFRDIAEQQLGPILELMGIREDPYEFFIDMFKLALALQLGSAALVFYGAELGLGLDAGDGFRAVTGLGLGYFLRLGIKIEHLAWPLYNAFVQLLIREDAVYEYPAASADERQDTLNKLGLVIASAFFVPKLLFGWQNDECWQIVLPMVGGLFFFDVCYILALLIKLWGHEDRQ